MQPRGSKYQDFVHIKDLVSQGHEVITVVIVDTDVVFIAISCFGFSFHWTKTTVGGICCWDKQTLDPDS